MMILGKLFAMLMVWALPVITYFIIKYFYVYILKLYSIVIWLCCGWIPVIGPVIMKFFEYYLRVILDLTILIIPCAVASEAGKNIVQSSGFSTALILVVIWAVPYFMLIKACIEAARTDELLEYEMAHTEERFKGFVQQNGFQTGTQFMRYIENSSDLSSIRNARVANPAYVQLALVSAMDLTEIQTSKTITYAEYIATRYMRYAVEQFQKQLPACFNQQRMFDYNDLYEMMIPFQGMFQNGTGNVDMHEFKALSKRILKNAAENNTITILPGGEQDGSFLVPDCIPVEKDNLEIGEEELFV